MHLSRLYFFHNLQTQRQTTALRHFALISDLIYKMITFQHISAPKFCVYSLYVNFKINNYGSSVTKVNFCGLDDWCDSQQKQGLYSVMSHASFLSHGRLKLQTGAEITDVWSFTSVCSYVWMAWAWILRLRLLSSTLHTQNKLSAQHHNSMKWSDQTVKFLIM